jgi:hypothetical protein
MPTSVECRLLCASVCAYSVESDGTLTPEQPYFDAAQFNPLPTAFVAGTDAINACLVATTVDGVVVAFRGTLPPSSPDHEQTIRDWMNDLNAELIQPTGVPGRVHEGFWNALDSFWQPVLAEAQRQMGQAGAGCNLFVTGHSKGGAMANLAAMRFKLERGITPTVRTFAAAHPGDEDFAAAYDNFFDNSTRYEYADDIVPHMPPSLAFRNMFAAVPFAQPYVHRLDLDYSYVGTLQFIDWDGVIQPDSPTLRFTRFEHLATQIVSGGFAHIASDHDSGCGGGYMSAICPQGVCT